MARARTTKTMAVLEAAAQEAPLGTTIMKHVPLMSVRSTMQAPKTQLLMAMSMPMTTTLKGTKSRLQRPMKVVTEAA